VHAQQQRKPAGGGQPGGHGAGGGHVHRHRTAGRRHHVDRREAEEPSVGAHLRRAGQPREQQVEGLGEAVPEAVQSGAEDLEVDPRPAAADAEVEPPAGHLVEQHRLLGERDRMPVRQDAGRGAHPQARGAAQHVRGECGRGRAGPVRQEMMFGDPRPVEAGPLGGQGVVHRRRQRRSTGEPAGKQKDIDAYGGRRQPAPVASRISSHVAPATG
jgi:hypothetical protein